MILPPPLFFMSGKTRIQNLRRTPLSSYADEFGVSSII